MFLIRRDGSTQPRAAINDATVNDSQSKPVKKEIIIKEGLNYKAGEVCTWYVEVSEENYQKLKAYKQKVSAVTIDGVISRFFDREYNQKPITTDDICLNLNSNLKQFSSERVRFILKAIRLRTPLCDH